MAQDKFVTFITPTVGRDTLQRACDSVDAQHNDGWYHYVIGDGLLPNVTPTSQRSIIEAPHWRHEAKVRNFGIQMTGTPWVAFLDDDDTVDETYVQILSEEIEDTPEVEVIIFRQTIPTEMQHFGDKVIPSTPEILWGNTGISYACTTAIAMAHPFKRSKHEDLLQLTAFEAAGAKIKFSDHILYYGRDHR